MISNPDRTTLISSSGWVEKDALWCMDVASGATDTLSLDSGARWATLHSSGSDRFAVVHHFEGARFGVSVRTFSDPARILAQAIVSDEENTITGDRSAWRGVPVLYVEYLKFPPWRDFVLLRVSPATGGIDVQPLEWYDDTYDKNYQGVVGVLELPGQDFALISVQRSSRLIVHDLATGKKAGETNLGGHVGNPRLQFRDSGNEIWASDYDTLVVVRTADLRVLRSARLQIANVGARQFIGDYSFAPDQDLCVVARPFSGDVIGVDNATLRVVWCAKLGRQPLEVAALHGGRVVARDWKTGDVLQGKLESAGAAG